LEGRDDDEDIEAPADERLRDDQGHDEPGALRAHDSPEPACDHSAEALAAGVRRQADAALDPDASEEGGAHDKRCSPEGEDPGHVCKRHEQSCEHRSDERSDTLDGRRRAVRRDQLLRCPRE
jgi:hypothetical protein